MDEYVKRGDVMKAYEEEQRRNGSWRFEILIESIPTSDVAPVRYGRWVPALHVGDCCYRCSECQFLRDVYLLDIGNYCPNCGAKMDGE